MNHLVTYLAEARVTTAPATWATYQTRLERFEGWARPKHGTRWLSVESVNAFLLELRQDQTAPSTIKAYQVVLNAFFNWLVAREALAKNPLIQCTARIKVVPRQKKEVFTMEEYQQIKAKAERFWASAVIIAWHTGLRLGDIALLERSEVDLEQGCLRLKPNKTSRYGTEVEIPLSGELRLVLEPLCANTGHLLPAMAKVYQSCPEMLSMQFSRLLTKAGVAGKSFHCFRATFDTRMLAAGMPVSVLSSITGQSMRVICQSYNNPRLEDKRKYFQAA